MPTTVWGPSRRYEAQLALDTGAVNSVLSAAIVGYLGHDRQDRADVVTAPRIRVQQIEALGAQRRDFAIVSHTLPRGAGADGVLGLDCLRGHRLAVDFREGLVHLG